MDYPGYKPDGVARLPLSADARRGLPAAGPAHPAHEAQAAQAARGGPFRLVSGTLVLAEPAHHAPSEWQQAIDRLISGHRISVQMAAPARPAGLRHMARWAGARAAAAGGPVFAPWQCASPISLQAPAPRALLPRAQWVAGYLFDCGADRPAAQRTADIMVMSPLGHACLADDDGDAALPRLGVLAAMIRAARAEGRSKLAIIVPARAANAMARRLLAADRQLTKGEFAFEIVSIEDAIGRLMGGGGGWDAMITLPELRSIVLAVLAQTSGAAGPWPLLWHDRDLRLISSEMLGDVPAVLPLDATVLMQALALAAHSAGLGHAAHGLYEGWARLRDSGVTTPARGSALPYANTISDAEFIDLAAACRASGGRPLPAWKALTRHQGNRAAAPPVSLSLVASR